MHRHSQINKSIPNHGPEVVEEIPHSKMDQVLLVLCISITAVPWESVVKVSTHDEQKYTVEDRR